MPSAKQVPNRTSRKWPRIREAIKNGKKVYQVDARIQGKGSRLDYKTKGEAQTVAEELRIQRDNQGTSAFSMTVAERASAQESFELLRPHGFTLPEAVRFMLKNMDVVRRDPLLAELVEERMNGMKADGCSKFTFFGQRSFYRRLSRSFPDAKLSDLTTPVLDDWLRTQPVSPLSRNSYRLLLSGLFTYAKQRKYCLNNPAKETVEVRVDRDIPAILPLADCTRLLQTCVEHNEREMVVCFALGLFAGLRPLAEVGRLHWEHIDFNTNLIDITPDRTKRTRKKSPLHRYVEMQPHLVEWLLPYRQTSGKIGFSPGYYATKSQLVRALARIPGWDNDILRHTFGSMHYEKFNDAGYTCKQMGHTGFGIFFEHYRARVTPEEAEAFWNIRPGQEIALNRDNNIVPMVA